MERYTQQELVRFNNRWIKEGQCHLWQGFLDKDGYGTFFFRHKGRRAHRVSYYIHVGDITKGLVIDHVCGKRNCVNPSHLRMITTKENHIDSRNAGAINARKTHCIKGHPFDKKYGKQRYCSICQAEKTKRLRAKWNGKDIILC